MADPLSVSSAAAGLISLGVQVAQGLITFYTEWRGQGSETARTLARLEFLLGIFQSLDDTLQNRKFKAQERDLLQKIETAILECRDTVTELQDECERFNKAAAKDLKDKIRIAGRRAVYPFRRGTLQNLDDNISDIRDHLSLALDVLQLKDHQIAQSSVSELKLLVERLSAIQVSSEIRSWLQAPDATTNHHAVCAKHQAGTGQWLIDSHEYQDWLTGENSFLWINGFAGSGKSVLCSTAIQNTFHQRQHGSSTGIAFFYFVFDNESKQDESGMLRVLLLQLAGQVSRANDSEDILEQLYSAYSPGTPPPEVLITYLERAIRNFKDTFIFLDALDESPRYSHREKILDAIETIRKWHLPGLHLLVTSRDESDIRDSLSSSFPDDSGLPEVRMRNPGIDKDITNFVVQQLSSDPKLQKWREHHAQIQRVLSERAQGVFRWVECQFNVLKKCPRNKKHLDACLKSLPKDLDSTYERLLCSIDEDCVDDVRRILTLLCFSSRPLTVAEIIHAHAVELNNGQSHFDPENRLLDIDSIQELCVGLITIERRGDIYNSPESCNSFVSTHTVHIAHFSVQEYLESERARRQKASVFAMQGPQAHCEIAQICLVYIMDADVPAQPPEKPNLERLPLLHFAVRHWHFHYQRSVEASSLSQLRAMILMLFRGPKTHFAAWMWVDHPDDVGDEFLPPGAVGFGTAAETLAVYYASLMGLDWALEPLFLNGIAYQGKALSLGLHAAAAEGHESTVRLLLNQGAELLIDGGHFLSLQAAATRGHEKIVQLLIEHGADVNPIDELRGFYGTPLAGASIKGHEGVVRLLLDRGADVSLNTGRFGTALQAASWGGHLTIVRILLERGADVNVAGALYGSALIAASARGHEDIVKLLLEEGADLNFSSINVGSALRAAVENRREKVVEILLEHGAEANVEGRKRSALYAAARRGFTAIVRLLLAKGADVNFNRWPDPSDSPLRAACLHGHEEIVQLLLSHGADVNLQFKQGTALHAAAFAGYSRLVSKLLDHGANTRSRSAKGASVIRAALLGARSDFGCDARENIKIALMLRDLGEIPDDQTADVNLDTLPATQDVTNLLCGGSQEDFNKMMQIVDECLSGTGAQEFPGITHTKV